MFVDAASHECSPRMVSSLFRVAERHLFSGCESLVRSDFS